MIKTIQIEVKSNYGTTHYYPMCSTAKCFARIASTKTLSLDNLHTIQSMGYTIESFDALTRELNESMQRRKATCSTQATPLQAVPKGWDYV